ncbi:hypothetical protein EIK77_005703 [Talaromyces pinophilus]|jgi:hypothetical protein|nr:hypothetical protein EIK77_005703 [Talaromyces pinophilus]
MNTICDTQDAEALEETKTSRKMDCEEISGEERSSSNEESQYPPTSKVMLIVLAIYLAAFLVALDQTIIGVAIPKITDQFKSVSDIGWYGSAYFLTSTALQPSYGRIYKLFSVGHPVNLIHLLDLLLPDGDLNYDLGKMVIPCRRHHLRDRIPGLWRCSV